MLDYALKGRAAIVTGGSKGIGKAIALALSREGVSVAICARGEMELKRAAAEIEAQGAKCLPVIADVRSLEDTRRAVSTALNAFGRIDILVNNATYSHQGNFLDLTDEHWQQHLNSKVMGYIRFARQVVPIMKSQKWGRIVNLAGGAARTTTPLLFTNGVTNASIANFTSNLARISIGDGITVNAIHPGYVLTERLEQIMRREADISGVSSDEVRQRLTKSIPLGRFTMPREIGDLTLFLCSEQAGAITGQAIAVDGARDAGVHY